MYREYCGFWIRGAGYLKFTSNCEAATRKICDNTLYESLFLFLEFTRFSEEIAA